MRSSSSLLTTGILMVRIINLRNTENYLKRNPAAPRAYFIMGEIERQGGGNAYSIALSYYLKAVELDDKYSDPYPAIGMLYLKKGDKLQAKKAFQQYLHLTENPPDRGYIEEYLKECDK